ncbi:MAG TPA: protein kinase [Pyrinomonadaceae bacterium]|jgi:tetratricopeptide (TPR) repeat protein/predicted Ser/Thr protein kinase
MIGKTFSHYRILGQVGEGGMGVVYVAEDLHLGRRVAIKIPHAGRDESHYRARFLREARSVSKLRHPNIAAVHDFGETDDGQPFIVMEYVEGSTLGDLLSGAGLSIARAVEVARQTAEALSEAHRRGVVHRDIKPSNVVVDEGGEVKVLDFGLAKQLHEEPAGAAGGPDAQTLLSARTRSDVVIGTPLYLSPEQARGAKVDGRSDLFALGALLYECLTGRPAFSGANVIEIGAQVLHFDPPPPSRFNPRVPAELDRVTLKALAKRPEDRFQSAAEFAAELGRVRSRLPDSDTLTTRRLAGADNGHRSSALITMAEAVRRPKFSLLTLVASVAGLALLAWVVWYLRQPSAHKPDAPAAALYQQGVDAMREGAYYRASLLLGDAVERDKQFALAHARLAEALLEMDFLDRAKDEMILVNTLAPDFKVYPRADALYLEALRSTLMQGFAAAISAHEEIVRLAPDRPQARLDLGRAYERNYQTDAAVRSYTEATRLDPAYAAAFLRLGALHARQKNMAGAGESFDRAQRLYAERGDKEGWAAVRYQRGRMLAGAGKAAEARAEFEQSLALARETNNSYQHVQALLQLAVTQDDGREALGTTEQAVTLAQSSGMNDQVANGYLTRGHIFFGKLADVDQAEAAYKQALAYARTYKLRRYVALALSGLGNVSNRRSRPEEAEQYLTEAREFYLQGGYRREADQCAMLIARSKRQKGDYGGALELLEEPLRLADQAGDVAHAGSLHHEFGAVLAAQEKYHLALPHYRQSVNAARALNNQSLLAYAQLNMAGALWWLGRYDEAEDVLAQLTGGDAQAPGVNKSVLASAYISRADMELSRRHFAEAAAAAGRAVALLKESGGQLNDQLSWAEAALGLAETAGGARARGKALCEEGVRLASLGGDQPTVGHAHYALALALLEAGDAAGARDAALRAREVFARIGRPDSEWRALAVAGKAYRLAGDHDAAREHFARAGASLKQLEQSLGAEATGYLSRPDVQWLRSDLGAPSAAAAR